MDLVTQLIGAMGINIVTHCVSVSLPECCTSQTDNEAEVDSGTAREESSQVVSVSMTIGVVSRRHCDLIAW